jgi:hypothetical protein
MTFAFHAGSGARNKLSATARNFLSSSISSITNLLCEKKRAEHSQKILSPGMREVFPANKMDFPQINSFRLPL